MQKKEKKKKEKRKKGYVQLTEETQTDPAKNKTCKRLNNTNMEQKGKEKKNEKAPLWRKKMCHLVE